MVPKQAPPPSATTTTTQPFPPLTRSTTLPAYNLQSIATDRTLLAPEDAIHQGSPPRKQSAAVNKLKELRMTNGLTGDLRLSRRGRHGDRTRSASRRKKGTWKKLLWVKQSCKLRARLPLRIELISCRPRQLYGSRYLPRTSTAKSATPAVRLLATGGGFDCDCPACVLSNNIHRLFRRNIHGTRLSRSDSRMGFDWHISGVVVMGLVGGTGRVATAIATNIQTRGISFQLPIKPQSESSIHVDIESP